MILTTRAYKPTPKEGDIREVVRFAFFPKWVGNDLVWLQRYFLVYEYRVRDRILPYSSFVHSYGDWDLIEKRILNRS